MGDREHEDSVDGATRSGPLKPAPPFIWPDPDVFEGKRGYAVLPPIGPIALSAKSLFGLVTDVDRSGVDWLMNLLQDRPELRAKLVLVVYPACRTQPEDLASLCRVQDMLAGRAEFRVSVRDSAHEVPGTGIAFVPESNRVVLALGSSTNFGCGSALSGSVNGVLPCDAALYRSRRRLLRHVWEASVRLTPETARLLKARSRTRIR